MAASEGRSNGIASWEAKRWLRDHDRAISKIHVSVPREVTCWTRSSKSGRHCWSPSNSETQTEQHDINQSVAHGSRQGLLKYCAIPSLPADLNEGYPESYIRKPEVKSGVEPIVEAIVKSGVDWQDCDVCTYRNNLNKIGKTPFSPHDAWQVDACFINQTLFLDVQDLSPSDNSSKTQNPNSGKSSQETNSTVKESYSGEDRFCYYGYKFEALCTRQELVDASSEFCSVQRIRIGDLRIFIAAEIDCYFDSNKIEEKVGTRHAVDKIKKTASESYMELKTSKIPEHDGQRRTLYKFKYPRWWLQSWLAGVSTVVVGWWRSDGQLAEVEHLRTTDLPGRAIQEGHAWDPWRAIVFIRDVLSWMKSVGESHPEKHLRFTYNPQKTGVILAEVLHNGDLRLRIKKILQTSAEDHGGRDVANNVRKHERTETTSMEPFVDNSVKRTRL